MSKRLMRTIGAICTLAILSIGLLSAEPVHPERESYYQGLQTSISLDNGSYAIGETMTVTINLTCTSESHKLFNPFFNGLIDQPGRIRVYDADGKLVSELLGSDGSRRFPNDMDWVILYPKCHVGRKLDLEPCINDRADDPIQPGRYKMQLVLTGAIIGLKGKEKDKVIAASDLVPFRIVSKRTKSR